MKFGFCLPTFSFPDLDFETAGRVRQLATRAEALGYDALWVPEHLLTARGLYGTAWLSPLEAVSFAAGATSRIKLATGGTDNHIVLLDVSSFGLTGRQAESALLDAGVVTNRNSVPQDPNGAWYTSGIRLGTPALTTRGFGHDEFDRVAELVIDVLANTTPRLTKDGKQSKANYTLADGVAERTKAASAEMLDKYPLYPGLEL